MHTITYERKKDFMIPTHRLDRLGNILHTINRKREKCGMMPIVIERLESKVKEVKIYYHAKGTSYSDDRFETHNVEYTHVRIVNDDTSFKLRDDLVFIGDIKIIDGVRTVYCNDNSYIDEFKPEREMRCDHCHTNRKRNSYYLFADSNTRKVLMIGSTCMQDYFGWDVAEMCDIKEQTYITLYECEEEVKSSEGKAFLTDMRYVYDVAMTLSNNFTDWKRTYTNSMPVAIYNIVNGQAKMTLTLDECDAGLKKVGEWYDSREFQDSLGLNAQEYLSKGYCPFKYEGMAGFIIFKAIKTMRDDSLKRKLEDENTETRRRMFKKVKNGDNGVEVTMIDEKITGVFAVEGVRECQSKYGATLLVTLYDYNGKIYKFFTGARSKLANTIRQSIVDEMPIMLEGLFKDLDYFKGTESTMMTKVKAI